MKRKRSQSIDEVDCSTSVDQPNPDRLLRRSKRLRLVASPTHRPRPCRQHQVTRQKSAKQNIPHLGAGGLRTPVSQNYTPIAWKHPAQPSEDFHHDNSLSPRNAPTISRDPAHDPLKDFTFSTYNPNFGRDVCRAFGVNERGDDILRKMRAARYGEEMAAALSGKSTPDEVRSKYHAEQDEQSRAFWLEIGESSEEETLDT